MPNYRRARVEGATYFFTVNLADRSRHLLTDRIDALRLAFSHAKTSFPFTIDAIVILPEHLHCVWTLPVGDAEFSDRWRRIKAEFSARVAPIAGRSSGRAHKGERGIWQRGFWEHVVRDDDDYTAHLDYIHFNPVRHGHVSRAVDWPFSSFRRYLKKGFYSPDWADTGEVVLEVGEAADES